MLKNNNHIILLIFLLFIGCSTKSKRNGYAKQEIISPSNSCSKLLENKKLPFGAEIVSQTLESTGTLASLVVSGMTYSTDLIISLTGGVFIGATICSPLLAVDVALLKGGNHGNNLPGVQCVSDTAPEISKKMYSNWGRDTYRATRKWRCPELDYLSEGLRDVSKCYKDSNELNMAKEQLLAIKKSTIFSHCLSKKEKQNIESELDQLSKI